MIDKIRPAHLERKAVVYLRQSSLKQVREHRESTNRQYALRERALALGWSADTIEIVDEDLGQSGKSSEGRAGFQRLAEEVAQGRIGGLFALEVSRLARSSADWYRLLDLAGLADVVIADEEVVYDPRDYNDRLLLGLKGQFADAELYWMRLRLNGGKLSKARRGELVFTPPIGYAWGNDGQLHLDPDEQVQRSIRLLFERFRLDGSAPAVVRYFAQHGLQMPTHDRLTSELRWTTPRHQWVLKVLHNPIYTGAYVFGRRDRRMGLVNGEVRRRRTIELPMESWKVCLRDHHPAYVSWEEYMANQKKLRDNWVGGRTKEPDPRGAAREGKALLQGLVLCGRCGHRMRTRYFGEKGYSHYVCHGAKFKDDGTMAECWSLSTPTVDEAVSKLFLCVIQPTEIDLSLAITRDAERQADAIARQWKLHLERARYEARLAERRYKSVDPDNRTVARTLEREWNDKLEEQNRLEREYQSVREREKVELSDEDRRKVLALAHDLPKVWKAPTTTAAERKNLLRMLIRDVTLSPIDVPERATRVQVLWVTGATSDLHVPRPTGAQASRTPSATVEAVRALYLQGLTDAEIVAEMNRSKIRPTRNEEWTEHNVRWLRLHHGMRRGPGPQASARGLLQRDDGLYSTRGVAELLGVPIARLYVWMTKRHLAPAEGGRGAPMWFRLEPSDLDRLRRLRASLVQRGYRIGQRRRKESEPIAKDEVHCV